MFLIEKEGLKLLLHLPEGLRKALFTRTDLDKNTKFVLATLYYLDSKNDLPSYQEELPKQTGLEWKACQESLSKLARMNLIEYIRTGVRLKIKPLTYNK